MNENENSEPRKTGNRTFSNGHHLKPKFEPPEPPLPNYLKRPNFERRSFKLVRSKQSILDRNLALICEIKTHTRP